MERKVWDVNVLAIYLVEDHPGNPTCPWPWRRGWPARTPPVVLGSLPLRVYWVLTSK